MSGVSSGLRRFVEAPPPAPIVEEHCEMCGSVLAERHGHVVNVEARSLLCACRPCYLLFTPDGAAEGRYRAVPDRCRFAADVGITAADWDSLQIPVSMAFFFHSSPVDRTVCFYPSPGGATESELGLDAFADLRDSIPFAVDVRPDVEAVIVRKGPNGFECYLAPIDACYELVGRMRVAWRGFDGGQEVRNDIEAFFADLRSRSPDG